MRLRIRFCAATIANTTKNSRNRYICTWLCSFIPNSSGGGTWIVASLPPEMNGTWLIVHWMINCAASVAMARYSPLMRSDGMPTSAPISAAIKPPAGTAIQNGASSWVIRWAPV